MKDTHKGKFAISTQLIEQDPGLVQRVLASGIVIEARNSYGNDYIEYIMVSPKFRKLQLGQAIPTYSVLVTRTETVAGFWCEFNFVEEV